MRPESATSGSGDVWSLVWEGVLGKVSFGQGVTFILAESIVVNVTIRGLTDNHTDTDGGPGTASHCVLDYSSTQFTLMKTPLSRGS